MKKADFKIGCVVMAAGNAKRFGNNKLAVQLEGRSLIQRTLDAVPASMLSHVVVVSQYPAIIHWAAEYHFSPVLNEHPDRGISFTIYLGLRLLSNYDAVIFMVADQPLLRRESIAALIRLWQQNPDRIAALSHGGVRGNPCIFPACFFPELMNLTEDHGGNTVIRAHEDRLLLREVQAPELTDVDTPLALEQLKKRLS
jgi:molybdenum cofactor cytidylyltransferase